MFWLRNDFFLICTYLEAWCIKLSVNFCENCWLCQLVGSEAGIDVGTGSALEDYSFVFTRNGFRQGVVVWSRVHKR